MCFAAPVALLELLSRTCCQEARCSRSQSSSGVLWMSLPYQPVWYRELNKLIGRFSRGDSIKHLFFTAFGRNAMSSLRIAWRNASSCLIIKVYLMAGGWGRRRPMLLLLATWCIYVFRNEFSVYLCV